ncbi:MAG: HTH domain-containing protein [Pseudomonadota bacterium]
MLDILGIRQKALLKLLLKNKAGMTADELSEPLAVTRNAVRQHLAALENNGLLKKGDTRASGGRPEQLYVLTEKGSESFARHYAWFAQLLVETIEQESGADGLSERLNAMGTRIGTQLRNQHPELVKPEEKIEKLADIMDQMGYSAQVANPNAVKTDAIEADNCVFHTLALSNPKVCQFDLALLSAFTGETVDHQQCMATGDHICRFKFVEQKK